MKCWYLIPLTIHHKSRCKSDISLISTVELAKQQCREMPQRPLLSCLLAILHLSVLIETSHYRGGSFTWKPVSLSDRLFSNIVVAYHRSTHQCQIRTLCRSPSLNDMLGVVVRTIAIRIQSTAVERSVEEVCAASAVSVAPWAVLSARLYHAPISVFHKTWALVKLPAYWTFHLTWRLHCRSQVVHGLHCRPVVATGPSQHRSG